MRMEDLDRHRTVEGSAEQILDDLRWLGLDWDEGPGVGGNFGPYVQSERDELYLEALLELFDRHHVFRCWCSRKDIREAASAPHTGGLMYPGRCRNLSAEEISAVEARKPDKIPSWRFRVDDKPITFVDEVCGPFEQVLAADVGDFPLRRADGLFAYQLAVVVDDILMGMTDVVRGDDLLDSTPRQIALYHALGFEPPRFWHVPLMRSDSGERMSKRNGSESLQELREAGWTPERVVGRLAASLGWCDTGAALSAHELLESLDDVSFRAGLR